MRTETLAVMFTDIKGYTAATSAQTHQQNARMLRRVERLVEPVVRAYNGRVVKSIGDAYMIVFRSPTTAVWCAAAVQDRLHLHNAQSAGEQSIHLRVALNVGEVRVNKGDVFGEPVNIAARIENVTPADEIYLSQAVYLTMNRSDLATERVGEFEFKGIPEPVTVHRVRTLAHVEEGTSDSAGAEREPGAPGAQASTGALPFGGKQLDHWRRVRWLRRASHAMWATAAVGLVAGAYLRYRPPADYSDQVRAARDAVQQNNPLAALAHAGEIPVSAVQERVQARRYRRGAVALLISGGKLDEADAEIDRLLNEDERDAEALLLRGILLSKRGDRGKAAMDAIKEALDLHPALAERPELIQAVVDSYAAPAARREADVLVDAYLGELAVPALLKALSAGFEDRVARATAAARLDKLGAGDRIDWVALLIDDLKSTSCKARRWAIGRLGAEGDERAAGPLIKLAESKGCGAKEARSAADAIMGR